MGTNRLEELTATDKCSHLHSSLLFFNPDFKDDVGADEQGVDALELAKQSEQSLNDLLGLKEDDEDEENILLEIDSQLESKKKATAGEAVTETIRVKVDWFSASYWALLPVGKSCYLR